MRKIRQALQLHFEANLSYAEIARATGTAKATVAKFVLLARAADVDWATAQTLTDEELESRLYRPRMPRSSRQLEPDYAAIHQELKHAGVTLQLLWEEYQRGGELAYKYAGFCVKYRAWALRLKRSMRLRSSYEYMNYLQVVQDFRRTPQLTLMLGVAGLDRRPANRS